MRRRGSGGSRESLTRPLSAATGSVAHEAASESSCPGQQMAWAVAWTWGIGSYGLGSLIISTGPVVNGNEELTMVHTIWHGRCLLVRRRHRPIHRAVGIVSRNQAIWTRHAILHGTSGIGHAGMSEGVGARTGKPTGELRDSRVGIRQTAGARKRIGTTTSLHVGQPGWHPWTIQRRRGISVLSLCRAGKVAASGGRGAQWRHGIFILAPLQSTGEQYLRNRRVSKAHFP